MLGQEPLRPYHRSPLSKTFLTRQQPRTELFARDEDWFASHDSCARFHANFSRSALASERKCAGSSCDALDECISKQLNGAP